MRSARAAVGRRVINGNAALSLRIPIWSRPFLGLILGLFDVWIGFCFRSSVRCFRCYWRTLFSHAFTGEIDAIGVVNESIQNGIDASSRALFDAVASEEFVLQRIVSEFARQRPAQSNCCCALKVILHRTARYPQHDRNLARARPASGKPKHLS